MNRRVLAAMLGMAIAGCAQGRSTQLQESQGLGPVGLEPLPSIHESISADLRTLDPGSRLANHRTETPESDSRVAAARAERPTSARPAPFADRVPAAARPQLQAAATRAPEQLAETTQQGTESPAAAVEASAPIAVGAAIASDAAPGSSPDLARQAQPEPVQGAVEVSAQPAATPAAALGATAGREAPPAASTTATAAAPSDTAALPVSASSSAIAPMPPVGSVAAATAPSVEAAAPVPVPAEPLAEVATKSVATTPTGIRKAASPAGAPPAVELPFEPPPIPIDTTPSAPASPPLTVTAASVATNPAPEVPPATTQPTDRPAPELPFEPPPLPNEAPAPANSGSSRPSTGAPSQPPPSIDLPPLPEPPSSAAPALSASSSSAPAGTANPMDLPPLPDAQPAPPMDFPPLPEARPDAGAPATDPARGALPEGGLPPDLPPLPGSASTASNAIQTLADVRTPRDLADLRVADTLTAFASSRQPEQGGRAEPSEPVVTAPELPARLDPALRRSTAESAAVRSELKPRSEPKFSEIAARVGNEAITLHELRKAYQEWKESHLPPGQQLSPEDRDRLVKILLDSLIERSLAVQEARRMMKNPKQWDKFKEFVDKAWVDEELPPLLRKYAAANEYELKQKLAERGKSLAEMREDYRSNRMEKEFVQMKVRPRISVDLPEMRDYYNAHLNDFDRPAQVTWREVVVEVAKHPNRSQALRKIEDLLARLRRGDDFANLAQAESDGPTAREGGVWKTSPGSYAVPAVNDALSTLPLRQISSILESPSSFHIVRVEARREAGPARFDEVQDEIRNILLEQSFERERRAFFDKLREHTLVTSKLDAPAESTLTATPPANGSTTVSPQ